MCLSKFIKIIVSLFVLVSGFFASIWQSIFPDPEPVDDKWTSEVLVVTATPKAPISQPTSLPPAEATPMPITANSGCAENDADIQQMLDDFDELRWETWLRELTGDSPATVAGRQVTILTRDSYEMFNGNPDALAYPYLIEQLEGMGYVTGVDIELQAYDPVDYDSYSSDDELGIWQNIIVTIPGKGSNRDELVLFTAHFDSTTWTNPENIAPGAEDNGSGTVTLFEAARLFKEADFNRTVKLIFFSGEEWGLYGSMAYVDALGDDRNQVAGVVNLDMFGYDSDDDRCFELHVGGMKDSQHIGKVFTSVIEDFSLGLTYDFLLGGDANWSSDHASFWDAGIGAIHILENMGDEGLPDGCPNSDETPYYHTEDDTVDHMNLPSATEIARAAIGAVVRLAGNPGCNLE